MALTCKLNRDILRTTSCGYSLPEVKDIYLANYADVTTAVSADSGGCETVSSITLGNSENQRRIQHLSRIPLWLRIMEVNIVLTA